MQELRRARGSLCTGPIPSIILRSTRTRTRARTRTRTGARTRRRPRWLVTLAGVMAVALLDAIGFDLTRAAEAWRIALLLGAAVMAVLLVPVAAAAPGEREHRYHEVGRRLIARVAGVALYAVGLFAGLAVALREVDVLFDLELSGTIYLHVLGWIAFGLAPWVLVGGAPDIVAASRGPGAGELVVRRFAAWLLLPLAFIYYLIVYAYFVRIAVLGEVPRNILSPLVIAAGALAVGLVQVLAWTGRDRAPFPGDAGDPGPGPKRAPVPDPGEPGGPRFWTRWTAPLFLPMAGVGLWGVALRTGQYGWTEFRYIRIVVLAALAALALAGTWAVARRRPLVAWLAPALIGAALLLAAVGPWSATAVSRRSQQARLAAALLAAEVYDGRTPLSAPADSAVTEIPPEQWETISSTLRYLRGTHGLAALEPVVDVESLGDDPEHVDLAWALGLRPVRPGPRLAASAWLRHAVPTSMLGEGAIEEVTMHRSPGGPGTRLLPTAGSTGVVLQRGGERWTVDLGPILAWLATASPPDPGPSGPTGPRPVLPPGQATLPLESAVRVADPPGATLVVRHIVVGYPDTTATPVVRALSGWAVLPEP